MCHKGIKALAFSVWETLPPSLNFPRFSNPFLVRREVTGEAEWLYFSWEEIAPSGESSGEHVGTKFTSHLIIIINKLNCYLRGRRDTHSAFSFLNNGSGFIPRYTVSGFEFRKKIHI